MNLATGKTVSHKPTDIPTNFQKSRSTPTLRNERLNSALREESRVRSTLHKQIAFLIRSILLLNIWLSLISNSNRLPAWDTTDSPMPILTRIPSISMPSIVARFFVADCSCQETMSFLGNLIVKVVPLSPVSTLMSPPCYGFTRIYLTLPI